MGLNYQNLDASTRALMSAEIATDAAGGKLHISNNLNPAGVAAFPALLASAAASGTDDSLAGQIRPLLKSHSAPRQLKSGPSKAPIMAINAHEMLAEGEFSRFYIRALCVRALSTGSTTVEVYRAKAVMNPRSASAAKIGTRVPAQALLNDLRANIGIDTALGLPSGPNSGLRARV
jgi:hypothetical protein